MHIGINGYFLGQETTGSGQYVSHLLQHLETLEASADTEYAVFVPNDRTSVEDRAEAAPDPAPSAQAKLTWTEIEAPLQNKDLTKLWWEQVRFPRACRQARVDLLHVPYFAPPLAAPVPAVVTIHDLIPLLLPAYHGSIRIRLYMQMVALAARRAAAIITDSQAAKKDIIQHLGLAPERVHVIYLAADAAYGPARSSLAAFRRRYDLPERYLLYLGGYDQRRNVGTLLQGFRRAIDLCGQREGTSLPTLVLAGSLPQEDNAFTPDPRRMIRELHLTSWARCLGRIPEADKASLYQGADVFLFPSLYEGFGLPPLEAMACGTPVIAADATSLPEIVGKGGLLVPPRDAGAWAEAICALWRQDNVRAALRDEALSQAARFSWDTTARETWQIYRQVLKG